MADIIKTYKEEMPALRLIGKRYTNADRVNGSYGAKWDEWFQNDWFGALAAQCKTKCKKCKLCGKCMNIENGYLGFMRCSNESDFEYWIGAFFPPDTAAPDGYEYMDIAAGSAGICWIKGKEDDGSVYAMHEECVQKLNENDMGGFRTDAAGRAFFFERYNCPRFTEKDADGNVILDYGIYLA